MSESAPGGSSQPPAAKPRAGLGHIIARNAAFALVGRVAVLVAWALVAPYMLDVLGENRFAIWALLFALSGYFLTFDLGLSQGIVKFVAEYSTLGDRRGVRGVATFAALIYLVLTAAAVVVLLKFQTQVLNVINTPPELHAEAGWCLVAMAIVFGGMNMVGILSSVLIGHQRMDLVYRISMSVTLIQVAGAVAVLSMGYGLKGLVINTGIGALLIGAFSWRAVAGVEPGLRFDIGAMHRDLLKRMAHFSAALQITNVGGFLQFQLDKVLLAHFVSLAIVSNYELAFRLSTAVWAIPLLPMQPLMPAVSHLGSLAERDLIIRLYRRASRYVFALAFPVAGFVIACAPGVVTAWLGPGYREVAIVTAGMAGFLLINVVTGAGTAVCRGIGKPWIEARYHLVGTVIHVALSWWLVPRMGLMGVLVALGVSGVIAVGYFMRSFHAHIKEPLVRWVVQTLAAPVVLSALATAVTLALRRFEWLAMPATRLDGLMQLVQGGLVFAAICGAGYLLTRYISIAEIKDLGKGVMKKATGSEAKANA